MQGEVADTATGERGDGFKVLAKKPTVKPRNARAQVKASAKKKKSQKPKAEKPCGNFDIIFNYFTRISQLCAITRAPCGARYLVPLLI